MFAFAAPAVPRFREQPPAARWHALDAAGRGMPLAKSLG